MTDSLNRELVQGARDLIADGWTQFHTFDGNTGKDRYSALGAIEAVTGPFYETIDIIREKRNWLLREFSSRIGCYRSEPTDYRVLTSDQRVQHWNDQPGRTQAEVLAIFDAILSSIDNPDSDK